MTTRVPETILPEGFDNMNISDDVRAAMLKADGIYKATLNQCTMQDPSITLATSLANLHFESQRKTKQDIISIWGQVQHALEEWVQIHNGEISPTGIKTFYDEDDEYDLLNKALARKNTLLEKVLEKYRPIDLYAALIVRVSEKCKLSTKEVAERTWMTAPSPSVVTVLKAGLMLSLGANSKQRKRTLEIIDEIGPPAATRIKQTATLKEVQGKGAHANKERAEAVKAVVRVIYEESHAQKPNRNDDQHARYISGELEKRTMVVGGKELPVCMRKGKPYSLSRIIGLLKKIRKEDREDLARTRKKTDYSVFHINLLRIKTLQHD
jgi:hypothetical protein